MATYNGQKYIIDQLNSILSQLRNDDEIVIVDDCSHDNTFNIIKSLNNKQINLYQNETHQGHVQSFAKAISLAKNDIIILSDQDDIWEKNKIELIKNEIFRKNIYLVTTNHDLFFDSLSNTKPSIKKIKSKDSNNYLGNVIRIFAGRTSYFGCTMGFMNEFKNYILPIPKYVESHDIWFALAANILKSNIHLDNITVHRRIHQSNVTKSKRGIISIIKTRIIHLKSIIELYKRVHSKKSGGQFS
jgi:glycosyltransferase involved in cell wall biosynthesis